MVSTRDDVRELFVRHGQVDVFDWVEDILDQLDGRRANHRVAEIELVRGDLEVADLSRESPFILVVDGNLRATGDLDFATGSLVVVMGEVTARNFRFGGSVFINRNLTLTGDCFGDHGDESAVLYCQKLSARALLLDHVTGVHVTELDCIVCSAEGWGLPQHIDYEAKDTHAELFVPEVLRDNAFSVEAAYACAHAGEDIFLPGVHERLRATKPPPVVRNKPH
ncbi:MAG: hypothetical protein ABI591_06180 [Kofleriaceae bacterium]